MLKLAELLSRCLAADRAQAGFEYLLAGGILAVGLALAFLAFKVVIPDVVGLACPVIDSVSPVAVGACLK